MASKALVIAGLVLLVAAVCNAESETENKALSRSRRGIIAWIIASFGDALKLFLDGLNKGVKGLITGLTYAFFGFFAGLSNGLQFWRIGIYRFISAFIDLAQNLLTFVLFSPSKSNFFGENKP